MPHHQTETPIEKCILRSIWTFFSYFFFSPLIYSAALRHLYFIYFIHFSSARVNKSIISRMATIKSVKLDRDKDMPKPYTLLLLLYASNDEVRVFFVVLYITSSSSSSIFTERYLKLYRKVSVYAHYTHTHPYFHVDVIKIERNKKKQNNVQRIKA